MQILKKYGCLILLVVFLREISLPFFMNFFSTGGSHHAVLLSQLGQNGMPMQAAFKRWEIIDGSLFIFSAPYFFERFKNEFKLSGWLFGSLIAVYGIGDCLMTAFFNYGADYFANWHSFLHALGSGIGSGALLAINFCLLILARQKNQPVWTKFLAVCLLGGILGGFLLETDWITSQTAISVLQCLFLDILYLPSFLITLQDSKKLFIKN
ncbi:DUF998 domain-containing protein [Liquorilactobacillus sicerae]|uniref:DUF998 domain-containing protein n=1 Tax=Liquorilactobacillus sicerae TaxID=1416943 RepID=UPI002480284F|nr:DUF998 domain-containing protein [Liquorilactobacillus sicerae]